MSAPADTQKDQSGRRVVSVEALMGRLAGRRLVAALEKDRNAERRR